MENATASPTVFVSYSRQDGKWLDELTTMLAPVVRAGIASVWWDKKIRPSQVWRQEIDTALASAQLAILLVSKHFLASDFIQDEELPFLIDAAQHRGVKLLWILVSPCLYEHSPLRHVQAAHDPSRPLSKLRGADRQEALVSVGRVVVEALATEPTPLLPGGRGESPQDKGGVEIHNLPYPPLGDLFTGRQEELDALESGNTAAITQSAAISGLGGIGKTRLAVEYAWRSGNRYTAVWFVRADSPENLRRNLAALAAPELLNLPEWEAQNEEKTVAAVKRWLREHPGWLMILDNVDTSEAADAVLEVLPSLSNGRILITTRLTTWPGGVRKQSLGTLSQEEAVRFLLHRTEEEREPAADDTARAADLAERVDGLPLALEQAAAYIIRHRMRLSEYLRSWEQEREKLIQWYDQRVMQYPASVAVTWKQTFDRLSPTSAALLRLTAFLAPDPIPFEMLEQGAEHVKRAADLFCEEAGTAADGKTVREAVADLADYSLITRLDGGLLVVHRMVQEVLGNHIPKERRKDWIDKVLRITYLAFPRNVDNPHSWPACDCLISHAKRIVTLADQVGIGDPTSRLMDRVGGFLYAKALYSEAEPFLRRALAIAEITFGGDDSEVAGCATGLGLILLTTNRLADAEPLMRRAVDIYKAKYGENHPSVASAYHNLAMVLGNLNRMDEAEQLFRSALSIDEIFNEDHMVARDLDSLAMLYWETNRTEEVEPLLRRALTCDEATYGINHSFVASNLVQLAKFFQAMHRRKEAEPLLRRAVAIFDKELGPHHPRTKSAKQRLEYLLFLLAPARACDIY